jgi:hypothetical protein
LAGPAHQSDQIVRAAGQSLAFQRSGGRRRGSIGRGSAGIKAKHFGRKLRNVLLAVGAIWLGLTVAGIVIDGIGITGIILGALATFIAVGIFGRYPKMKLPSRADLSPENQNVRQLVGQTELWLESQRRALPPPAVKLVDHIGLQLDALGLQLQDLDQSHPKATEVRKLVGEHLPNVVDGYRKIPEHLRHEAHSGTTPAKQFIDSLTTISGEIDSVTRQLAAGAIDNLSIQNRYLEYKYGAGPEGGES